MGGIDEVSAAIGSLRSDFRSQSEQMERLAGSIDKLQEAIERLQKSESARNGFNRAMAVMSGVAGGIISPVIGWAVGFIHISIR